MTARLTGSTTTPNTEKTIWNTLYAEIGNAFGVAGLMGNLYAESALNPQNLQNNGNSKLGMTDAEFTKAVDSGKYAADTFIHDGYGYALAQWTYYSRKQALLNYAKTAGKSIGDLSMQLGFLLKEIKSCKQVWNTLVNAATVREASDAVLLQFERLPIRAIRFGLVEQLTVRSIMKSIRMVSEHLICWYSLQIQCHIR